MIVKGLLELIFGALKLILSILPSLPGISFIDAVLLFINDVFKPGIGLLCFFIRPQTLIFGFSTFILIFTFEHSYKFVMWVMKKIPFFGIG